MALAAERAKPIYKAARVANMNGWFTAIVAVLSAPFALFDLTGLVMFVGLSLVAYNEFRGRNRLRKFDPSGASLLGFNQLSLMAVIVVYCLWMMFTSLTSPSPFATELSATPELKEMFGSLGDLDDLYQSVVIVFYGTVILLSVVFQGLNALYYFSRQKYVDQYVAETPEWVRDVQRAKTIL